MMNEFYLPPPKKRDAGKTLQQSRRRLSNEKALADAKGSKAQPSTHFPTPWYPKIHPASNQCCTKSSPARSHLKPVHDTKQKEKSFNLPSLYHPLELFDIALYECAGSCTRTVFRAGSALMNAPVGRSHCVFALSKTLT